MLSPQGRDFLFDDCGRAFTCLPVEEPQAPVEAVVCNLDCLLDIMSHRVRGLAWEPHFPPPQQRVPTWKKALGRMA